MAITEEQRNALLSNETLMNAIRPSGVQGRETTSITSTDNLAEQIQARKQARISTPEGDLQVTEEIQERPGFLQRVKEKFTGRTEELGETLETADPVTGALATTATGIGVAADVATEGAKSLFSFLTPDFIEKPVSDKLAKLGTQFAESKAGQTALKAIEGGVEAWEDFSEKHPTISTNVESVATIVELFPALKGAQLSKSLAKRGVKSTKELAEAQIQRRAAGKTAKEVEQIGETISPGLTAKETRRAATEGRLIRQKRGTLRTKIFGEKPDVVIVEDKVKNAASTIQNKIPNAIKLTDQELNTALKDEIRNVSTSLKPVMKDINVTANETKSIKSAWDKLKKQQSEDPEFVAFPGSKKAQTNFEAFLNEATKPDKTLDDIWNIRKRYDNSIRLPVKEATDTAAPSTQLQKEMWIDNRRVLNDLMVDMTQDMETTARQSFDEMSDMYLARQNIIGKTKLGKGKEGVFTKANIGKAAAGLLGGALGLKLIID